MANDLVPALSSIAAVSRTETVGWVLWGVDILGGKMLEMEAIFVKRPPVVETASLSHAARLKCRPVLRWR